MSYSEGYLTLTGPLDAARLKRHTRLNDLPDLPASTDLEASKQKSRTKRH